MLKNIHVKNFALIDEVEIDLSKGLNILTGETGAGKSIIIDAVNFALGQRVSKDVVREDTEYALSELVFSVSENELDKFADFDISADDEIIISRKISKGKSVARINGETVTVSQLKDFAGALLDIHGQHDNQSLLSTAAQHSLLDSLLAEKLDDVLSEIEVKYSEYKNLVTEYQNLTDKDNEKELAYLKYQYDEIESASLTEGEDDEVESLFKKMNSAKKIAEALTSAHRLTGYGADGAGSNVGRALSQIRMISDLDSEAKDLELILTDIDSLLNDFNRSVADYEDSLEFSDEEYFNVETRINTINSLKSKYGQSVALILSRKDEIKKEIDVLENADEYKADLSSKIAEVKRELIILCEKASSIRKSGADTISHQIEEALKDLNFLDSRFEIRVLSNEENITAKGYDEIEFFVCTNPGEKLKPLINVASGGEMSRIMLAIKSIMAKNDNIPTLIFDEIDTGISGRTAQKVAEKMHTIAKNHQVIVVTHLPQIAAMADSHYEIKKETKDGKTNTGIRMLSNDEIITELARMLGGVSITDAVIENAKDMKEQADSTKQEL